MFELVNSYVKLRKYMYDKRLCHVDSNKLRAITKIQIHLEFIKNKTPDKQANVIRYLLSELELIMPGVQSSKYYDCKEKLEKIKSYL